MPFNLRSILYNLLNSVISDKENTRDLNTECGFIRFGALFVMIYPSLPYYLLVFSLLHVFLIHMIFIDLMMRLMFLNQQSL